jgi:putative oxidoreductase
VQLILRLALAVPFWKSGVLKWNGFLRLNDTAVYLFADEFKLHLPGGPYDFPAPAVMAFVSGCGEIIFPALLVLGLGTRFAALGLLFMTCIVELTVPDGWPIHITWAAMALAIMAWGPGRLSIDHALRRRAGQVERHARAPTSRCHSATVRLRETREHASCTRSTPETRRPRRPLLELRPTDKPRS